MTAVYACLTRLAFSSERQEQLQPDVITRQAHGLRRSHLQPAHEPVRGAGGINRKPGGARLLQRHVRPRPRC